MRRHRTVRWGIAFVIIVFMATTGDRESAWAQALNPEIEALRKDIEELRRREAEHQKQLEDLQRRLEELQAQPVPAKPAEAPACTRTGPAPAAALPTSPALPAHWPWGNAAAD
jgi:TolA-binding protein